ncbi:MAG: YbaB/EbfC family nucleoid-associated protein [Pseudomonadota bacterium]
MKDLGDIMRQAQEMQAKLAEAQQKIEDTEATGVAGAGMVSVTLRGKGDLTEIKIDPSLMGDEADILEDLIKAAHADARKRLNEATEKAMKSMAGGLGGMLPGFKLPF